MEHGDYTGILCFIVLCFTVLHRYCVFYKLKVCGNPASEQAYWHHFSKSICSFHVSMSHFDNSLNISNFFIIILIMVIQSVIFDITIVVVWGHRQQCLYKMVKLLDKCCVCPDCSTNQPFLCLSTSPGASLFPEG